MLAEFVRSIAALGQSEKSVQLIKDAQFPDEVLVRIGETANWKPAPAPKRTHAIHSLADFIAAAVDKSIATDPEVYHDEGGVVLVLDRDDRRQTVTMPLHFTERFTKVSSLALKEQTLSVRDAVRLIRFDLHGIGADVLVAGLNRLDFTRTGTNTEGAKHGRESLGRSVETAVQQADQVPEQFVARVPVYANNGLRAIVANITCGIYLDTQNPGIAIKPLADEIVNATDFAQRELHLLLATGLPGVPVFHGTFAPKA